jgi:hypothetical protein
MKYPVTACLILSAFAATAAPTRWVAAPNPDASFPGTQIVTGYSGAIGGIPSFLFNPGNKNLWITTVCASGGTVNLAGMAIVANGCREALPGLLVPKNEPVLCAAVDCAFTGILK